MFERCVISDIGQSNLAIGLGDEVFERCVISDIGQSHVLLESYKG